MKLAGPRERKDEAEVAKKEMLTTTAHVQPKETKKGK